MQKRYDTNVFYFSVLDVLFDPFTWCNEGLQNENWPNDSDD